MTNTTPRSQGGLDSSTYRIRDQSPIIDHQSIDQDMNTIKEEVDKNKFNEADYQGGQNGNRFNEDQVIVNKDDTMDQVKDQTIENVEEIKDNNKEQAGDWDDDGATPKEGRNVDDDKDDNVVQNRDVEPDKKSTGSQVYTPTNQMREEVVESE